MLTNKDYCDYDTCVPLIELGYNDSTDLRYNDSHSLGDFLFGIKAPTLYEAQKWLREEKNIIVCPEKNSFGWYYAIHYNVGEVHQLKYSEECDSYEDALLEGIKEAVKILKEK